MATDLQPAPPPVLTGETAFLRLPSVSSDPIAWEECMRTDEVAVALTHKLLHHRRPELFPLIEGKTGPRLEPFTDPTSVGLWSVIHGELTTNAGPFPALEAAFAGLATGDDGVPLHRLRLHDILLWLVATKNWDFAVARGRATPA